MAAPAAPTARKKPRQDRARATTDAILQAAARILVEGGVEAATTNRIAERAGVSVGSLYQYFPNKEGVLFALVERHVARMLAQLETMAAELAGAPVEQAIPAYVRAMFAAHRVEPRLHRAISEQLGKLAGRDVLERWSRQTEEVVRAYLEAHRAELRPLDLDLAAFLLVHAVDSLTHAVVVLRPRILESDALAEQVSQLVLRYLLDRAA